jgi:DNA segregation ATPase FtsK/SpoIIIE-like protein
MMMIRRADRILTAVTIITALIVVAFQSTTTAVVTPVYAQTPTTPQQPASNGVSILSTSQYSSEFGYTYIVGEVRNNLEDLVNFVQIVGRFYDSEGVLIDTDFTYTTLDMLRPGEKSPFKLIISDESVAQRIANYTLAVDWDPVFAVPARVADATVLTVQEGEQRIGEFGGYEVVGEVVNGGADDTEFVKIAATFYDENGRVIETDYTYTDPSDVGAGQSAPFEITVLDEDISEEIASVKLTAQSNDYFAIDPELAVASTPTTAPPPQQQQQPPPQQQQQPPPQQQQQPPPQQQQQPPPQQQQQPPPTPELVL